MSDQNVVPRQRMTVANDPDICRICRVPVDDLVNLHRLRVFQNYFYSCAGTQGYTCEGCIVQYVQTSPNRRQECHTQWRNVTIRRRRRTYQEFLPFFHRHPSINDIQEVSSIIFTGVTVIAAMIVFFDTEPLLSIAIFTILLFGCYFGFNQVCFPVLVPRLLHLLHLLRLDAGYAPDFLDVQIE